MITAYILMFGICLLSSPLQGEDKVFRSEKISEHKVTHNEQHVVLALHNYFDARRVGEADELDRPPRRGYYLTARGEGAEDDLSVVWARGGLNVHLVEHPTENAEMWWDEEDGLLWIAIVWSFEKEYSIAEVHALPMKWEEDSDGLSLSDGLFLVISTRITHPNVAGEFIVSVSIAETRIDDEKEDGVLVTFSHSVETEDPIRVRIDRSEMREAQPRPTEWIQKAIEDR